jgi:hypothetical protein
MFLPKKRPFVFSSKNNLMVTKDPSSATPKFDEAKIPKLLKKYSSNFSQVSNNSKLAATAPSCSLFQNLYAQKQ